jgi:hypothetical protein
MSHPDAAFLRKYLAPLRGGTITGVRVKVEDDGTGYKEAWPTLLVTAKDGKTTYKVEVSMDEEGNGPGFLFGLPFPEPAS